MGNGDPASAEGRKTCKSIAKRWYATVKRWVTNDRVRTVATVAGAMASVYGALRGGGGPL